ncbi:hypothetical protein HOD88_02625 [archaeon]|jgi:hypothetical protein|nr:hypothetical protein [archaeon]
MKCTKCNYESEELILKQGMPLCPFCLFFSPSDIILFKEYVAEKVNLEEIKSFRKNFRPKGDLQKEGMSKKAKVGKVMSRAPFGYEIQEGELIPAENFREVEEIFEDYLRFPNLTQLSKKHDLSVNGLKKVLTNFTYIGKIKFNNEVFEGNHKPLISSTLFNHVQNKIDFLKKIN